MRSVKFFVAAGAASLLSSVAFAADMPAPPPYAPPPPADTGGIFGVGVGYQFNNWFRADITGQYRGNANYKGMELFNTPIGGGAVAAGVDNYSASKSELLFLANVYA